MWPKTWQMLMNHNRLNFLYFKIGKQMSSHRYLRVSSKLSNDVKLPKWLLQSGFTDWYLLVKCYFNIYKLYWTYNKRDFKVEQKPNFPPVVQSSLSELFPVQKALNILDIFYEEKNLNQKGQSKRSRLSCYISYVSIGQ